MPDPGAGEGTGVTPPPPPAGEAKPPVGLGQAADALSPTTPEAEAKPDRIGTQRAQELSWAASVLFSSRKEGNDPAGRVLDTADFLGNLPKDRIAGANAALADGSAGEMRFMVGDTQVQLVEILDSRDPKKMSCKYMRYEMVPDADGKLVPGPLDTTTVITADGEDALLREEVVDTYLLSEKQTIIDAFSGNEKTVVETHFALMDPTIEIDDEPADTPELKTSIEAVAKDRLLLVDDMKGYIQGLLERDMCSAAEGQQMLDMLGKDGQIIISPDTIRTFLDAGGLNSEGLGNKIQELGEEKKALQKKLATQTKGTPEYRDTQRKIDEAKAAQALCEGTRQLLGARDDQGRDMIEQFFDRAYAGNIDLSKMGGLISAFRAGNVEELTKGIVDGLPMPAGLTEKEQTELKRKILKGVTIGSGVAVGVPLGLLALAAAIIFAVGGGVMSGMKGQ